MIGKEITFYRKLSTKFFEHAIVLRTIRIILSFNRTNGLLFWGKCQEASLWQIISARNDMNQSKRGSVKIRNRLSQKAALLLTSAAAHFKREAKEDHLAIITRPIIADDDDYYLVQIVFKVPSNALISLGNSI